MDTHDELQRAIDRLTQARSFLRSAETMIREARAALAHDPHCRDEAERLSSELGAARDSTEGLMRMIHSGCVDEDAPTDQSAR